jgi:protein gp37
MNQTKIEWTNYSWNPITGCLHGCWYCYAKKLFTRFHKSFEPTFYPERLGELGKLKKPAKIFVCSVADLFASWTKPEWRNAVLNEIHKPEYNHLTFQLLTKNPVGIPADIVPKENIWIGTTITCQQELIQIGHLVDRWKGIKFVSFEPLLSEINPLLLTSDYWRQIDWVIIGKLTGSKKVKLEKHWVENLVHDCRAVGIPIFLKNNLKWSEKIQEFPKPKL